MRRPYALVFTAVSTAVVLAILIDVNDVNEAPTWWRYVSGGIVGFGSYLLYRWMREGDHATREADQD